MTTTPKVDGLRIGALYIGHDISEARLNILRDAYAADHTAHAADTFIQQVRYTIRHGVNR